jgi:hypothetical protein
MQVETIIFIKMYFLILEMNKINITIFHGKYRNIKILVFILASVGSVFVVRKVFKTNDKINEKYSFYESEMVDSYYREIPSELDPNFVATLTFCKHKLSDETKDGYSGTMLSLVRKGYIELDRIKSERDWKLKNIKIVVKDRLTRCRGGERTKNNK